MYSLVALHTNHSITQYIGLMLEEVKSSATLLLYEHGRINCMSPIQGNTLHQIKHTMHTVQTAPTIIHGVQCVGKEQLIMLSEQVFKL